MYLVVIDPHSKLMDVHIIQSTTSAATITKLRKIFANHGLPETLVSDNGSNFASAEFENLLVKNGIRHIRVSPYHPASNGQAKRAVRVFKEAMKKMEGGCMHTKLSRFLLKYRTTPHSTTGVPPAQLLVKIKLRTKLDLLLLNTASEVRRKQGQQKDAHDYHARERELEVGDPVLIKDFSSPKSKSWQEGIVVQATGPVSALVELQDGRNVRRHQDRVRRNPSSPKQGTTLVKPNQDTSAAELVDSGSSPDECSIPKASGPRPPRPVRERPLPERLKDYKLWTFINRCGDSFHRNWCCISGKLKHKKLGKSNELIK